MNKIGNLLWKIFSATMVFFYNADARSESSCGQKYLTFFDPDKNETITDISQYTYDKENNKPVVHIIDNETKQPLTDRHDEPRNAVEENTVLNNNAFKTKTLCYSGKYLSACTVKKKNGSTVTNKIGTYWLKGLNRCEFPGYYSYDADSENSSYDITNMTNLRLFFGGSGTITYTKPQCESNCTAQVSSGTYKKQAQELLTEFCTNYDGTLGTPVCSSCDSNATVAASTVQTDTYGSGKIFLGTWNIHTIADCYMNEFQDNTGTYVYVPESADTADAKAPCYNTKTVTGTNLS